MRSPTTAAPAAERGSGNGEIGSQRIAANCAVGALPGGTSIRYARADGCSNVPPKTKMAEPGPHGPRTRLKRAGFLPSTELPDERGEGLHRLLREADVADPEPLAAREQLAAQVGDRPVEEEWRVDELRHGALEPRAERVDERAWPVGDAGVDDEDVELDGGEPRAGGGPQSRDLALDGAGGDVGDHRLSVGIESRVQRDDVGVPRREAEHPRSAGADHQRRSRRLQRLRHEARAANGVVRAARVDRIAEEEPVHHR